MAALASRHFLVPREAYQLYLEAFVSLTNSSVGYLHLYDADSQELELNVWTDAVIEFCRTSHVSHYPLAEAGIWADCVREGRPVIHNDYAHHPNASPLPEGHFKIDRHVSFPVMKNGKVIAVIGIGNAAEPYSETLVKEVHEKMELTWPLLEAAVERLTLYRQSIFSNFKKNTATDVLTGMMKAIGLAMEARDEYTSHHQTNVAFISTQLAELMGESADFIYGLDVGASVHDIGKVSVPAELLTKPAKLSAIEFALIQSHAEIGASFFQDVQSPWPIQEMILQHHERMDGTGYPNNLVGSMICLEARIIAVADTFDAMAQHRPYRRSLGTHVAMEQLKSDRGRGFDAYVVDAMLALYETDPTIGQRYLA